MSRTLPSSWETSVVRLPCSNPTPAALLVSDHYDTAAWPLVCKKQRLPRKVFRSSIAWLSDSRFTLRGVSYLSTTQNSLPVAGQALLIRIRTCKVPMKGFKFVNYISFPLPKLCLAQLHRHRAVHEITSLQLSRNLGRRCGETAPKRRSRRGAQTDGTMADNTVIVYLSDHGDRHGSPNDLWPMTVFGDAGGAFKTDRTLNTQFPETVATGRWATSTCPCSTLPATSG